MIYIIPAILLFISLGALAFIIIRKFPALVLIDVETIAKERDARVKKAMLTEHAARIEQAAVREIKLALRPLLALIKKAIQAGHERILELERKYRHAAASAVGSRLLPKSVKKMMEEAESLERRGSINEAEQALVEVIKAEPKNAKAYEKLGRLYQRNRRFAEAEESFAFALTLNPEDASVHANLGELAQVKGDARAALEHFQAAVAIKPSNPRYLDFLLEAALGLGERDLARGVFVRLKDVNPENQKLAAFEQRIKDM